jgi:hypothetical protein
LPAAHPARNRPELLEPIARRFALEDERADHRKEGPRSADDIPFP